MKRYLILILFFFSLNIHTKAQMTLTVHSKINTVCNGNPCNYSGPSILINEVMLTPLVGDGSTYDLSDTRRGEWTELYNPNLCKSVDISCFYLGNNAEDNAPTDLTNYGSAYRIPPNTIVPARGFVVIRGTNAPAVPGSLLVKNGGRTIELIGNNSLDNICLEGNRLWFPNAGAWFAMYDRNGVPQDAISWNDTNSYSCLSCAPCVASCTGCSNATSLASYDAIPANLKTYITSEDPASTANPANVGRSWCRIPDGGPWSSFSHTPTEGTCNSTCNPAPVITCNGMAWVTPSGGVSPYSYKWNDSLGTTTDTVKGLCTGIYRVTVTDSDDHADTISVQIKNLVLAPGISVTDVKCYGETNGSATATVSNGTLPYAYTWNNGGNTSTINNLSAGSYSVIITDSNDCSGTITTTVTQPTQLNVAINKYKNKLCFGDTTKVVAIPSNGTQPYTYIWYPGDSTSQSISLKNAQDTLSVHNFGLTVRDSLNCKDSTAFSVTYMPKIKVQTTSVGVCQGNSGTIFAIGTGSTGPYSYLWQTGATTSSVTVNPNSTTVYSITITDGNNCQTDTNATVTVNPKPKVQTTSVVVCQGNSGTIFAIGTGSTGPYSYLWQTGATTSSITVNPNSTTVYSITITDKNICHADTNATVTVNPKPIVQTASVVVCQGSSGTLTATGTGSTGPYSYLWQTGATTSSITVNPNSTTVYSITITDKNTCHADTNATVTVNPKPIVQTASVVVCQGSSGTLTATGTGSTGPYSYLWQTGATTSSITVNPNSTTVYSITVTGGNNCQADTNATVTVNPPPTVSLEYKNKLCFGDTTKVVAIPSNGTQPYTYIWYPGNNTTQSIILTNTQDTLSVHNFSLSVRDSLNCKHDTAFSVTYLPEIKIQAKADSVCPETCNGLIVLKVTDSNGNTDANSNTYLWSNQKTTKNDTLLCQGTYQVTITDQNNCKRIVDSIIIPSIQVDTSHSVSPMTGYSPLNVNFVYNGKDKNITWIFGDVKGDSSKLPNITHTYNDNLNNSRNGITIYNAEIIIKNSKCTDTIKFRIEVKETGMLDSISNVITSINNWFGAEGKGLKIFNVKIFDRWGVEVYEKTNFVPESTVRGDEEIYYLWDGANKNGNKVSEGTYFYILNAVTVDDKVLPNKKGTITVLK